VEKEKESSRMPRFSPNAPVCVMRVPVVVCVIVVGFERKKKRKKKRKMKKEERREKRGNLYN
jgi:hypothetical protein